MKKMLFLTFVFPTLLFTVLCDLYVLCGKLFEPMPSTNPIIDDLKTIFGDAILAEQSTRDEFPTLWVTGNRANDVLRHLKTGVDRPYTMLYDLTAIDERARNRRQDQPESDFTVVYHLLSYDRNDDIRIKVPLKEASATLPTITNLWQSANWYEREVWDLFGIRFDGHPHLQRLLMPRTWKGHPLRKDHPARATEMGPFQLPEEKEESEQAALKFKPEDWGLRREAAVGLHVPEPRAPASRRAWRVAPRPAT
jgi:NADH-quinone oxidoreductase subunit C/D